jgi:putative DNA primase/helicase
MAGLDFDGLARQLLASAESHLASWLPGGRKRGTAWVAGDLSGASGQSLKINLSNGAWSDFATGDHGSDLISLYAAIHGLQMGDAYKQLGGESKPAASVNGTHRPPPPSEPARRVVTPVPEAIADCACVHPRFGQPSHRWTYFDGNGEVLGYVARYDPAGDRKQIIPWTWDGDAWGMGQWPAPRPLYGLQELAARPNAAVLVVEGEKAADAARGFATPYAVVTWPAGAMAVDKADWTPLKGRKVLLWPDADEPGKKAMQRVAQIIAGDAAEVKVLDVSGQPDGSDAADAGFSSWQDFRAWAINRASVWAPVATRTPPALPAPPQATEIIDPETGEVEALPPEFSDDSLALEFVAQYGAGLRWSPGLGWMHDDGTHWKRDEHLIRFDLARRTARASAQLADAKIRKAITSAKTVNALLFLAQSDPAIVVPAAQWDSDPLMINTPAGIVDLRTGKLHERNRGQYLTQISRVSPDTQQPTENWLRFISQVFADDIDTIEFVQRMCGYCLSGDRREQKLFFAHGQGSNGKSTLLDILMWMMGSYALKLPTTALMASRNERHPTELAQLHGKRLAVSNELEEGSFWAEARIKELTGDETLTARFMRQDNFTFTMSHKHLIAGNHKPRLKGGDPAMARRMVLLPFLQKFEGAAKDAKLPEKLKAEAPGIMAWAIEGARKWYADGLAIPGKVEDASRDYMAEHDDIAMWIEECCKIDAGTHARSSDLYASFRRWKQSRGEHEPSQTVWGEKMTLVSGLRKVKMSGIMTLKGIDLNATEKARNQGLP